MLHSSDKCATTPRPAFIAWFGNFFDPYFSSREAVAAGLDDLRSLGINSIVLDSKLWSDFSHYFRTGEESAYVRMQKFIAEQCEEKGLGVSFLALFATGDNLYPEIYDHPPEYVDQPVDFQGIPYRGYRHWSQAQADEHFRHCLDLHRHIGRDATAKATDETGAPRLPFYFYHSPIFAPSFDEDGRSHYLGWLRRRHTLEALNERYGTNFASFDELGPADYWSNPGDADEDRRHIPSVTDYAAQGTGLRKYADNQAYKRETLRIYFRDLVARLRAAEPRFYFYAALSQWKFFFSDFVHIQNRGWDLWDLGKILDSPSFITMPVDQKGDAEPYVVPCEMAMLRSAAEERDFVGSLFLGRYMANDVYAICSPAEVIASAFGAGATDLYFYGYNGLDDGGNFGRWDEPEKTSLRQALDWFTSVRAIAGGRAKPRGAAILFPLASYTLSAFPTDRVNYQNFRSDLLGWYRQLADLGINADILHPSQIKEGKLEGYTCLIVPADPLYRIAPDAEMERELRTYVESGGLLLHGPDSPADQIFGLETTPHEADSFAWEEKVIVDSPKFSSNLQGRVQATYLGDRAPAYVIQDFGRGEIHSFGFYYGYAYGSREHLPVPRKYKRENHYPLTIIRRTPVEALLVERGLSPGRARGIEEIPFANGVLTINHTPYTRKVARRGPYVSTFEGFDGSNLPGRHAVFVQGR